MLSLTMVEYEFKDLRFTRDVSRSEVRQTLAEAAEYGHWELHRKVVYLGGVQKAWLRRKLMVELIDYDLAAHPPRVTLASDHPWIDFMLSTRSIHSSS